MISQSESNLGTLSAKRNHRRVFAIIATLVIACALIVSVSISAALKANAAETETIDNLNYTLDASTGTAIVASCATVPEGGAITIPEKVTFDGVEYILI